jgi:carbon catabolite-derepressing protein kinase
MLCGKLPFDDEYSKYFSLLTLLVPNLFRKINGGVYTLPSYLSSDTRNILQSMLIVDPLKRATIADIRSDPWFQSSLPAYLKPAVDQVSIGVEEADNGIMVEVARVMGYKIDTVKYALSSFENNQIKVAYQLLLDRKKALAAAKKNTFSSLQSLRGTAGPEDEVCDEEN